MLDNFELPNETINKAYGDVAHPAASCFYLTDLGELFCDICIADFNS